MSLRAPGSAFCAARGQAPRSNLDPLAAYECLTGSINRSVGLLMELPLIDFVTLAPVPESQRQIITNLIQLYKYDFSEFADIGSSYGEVGPDGRFIYDGLDNYWREDGWIPLKTE